jgi:hypothetical protein
MSIVRMILTRSHAAVQISSDPIAGLGALDYSITPDSTRVVYTAEMNTALITELFSAPIDQAGMQIQLNSMPVLNGELSGGITLTPDGATVVYAGDLDSDQQFGAQAGDTHPVNGILR